MIIIINTPPSSEEAQNSIKKAAELTADIILIGPAAALAQKDMLTGFCGTAFALEDDLRTHMPKEAELEKGVKVINADELDELLKNEAKGIS